MNHTLLISALSIVLTPLAQAQFSGGIVYDPTQAGNAGRQIVEGIKLYNTAVQTQQQLIQQYNLAKRMSIAPLSAYGSYYSNSGNQAWVRIGPSNNTYGNTQQWTTAMTTGNGSFQANLSISLPHTGQVSGYSGLNTQGQQSLAANGATIDLGDTANATTIQTLGTIRANSATRESDIQKLEAATHSTDPANQTQQAVLQRINQALLIELRTQQETNQMLQAQTMQQMVQSKAQQDGMKRAMQTTNTSGQYFNQYMPTTSGTLPVSTTH